MHLADHGVARLAGLESLRVVDSKHPVRMPVVAVSFVTGSPMLVAAASAPKMALMTPVFPKTGLPEDRDVHASDLLQDIVEGVTKALGEILATGSLCCRCHDVPIPTNLWTTPPRRSSHSV